MTSGASDALARHIAGARWESLPDRAREGARRVLLDAVGVIHAASGTVSESDILLAVASKAIIIGFNTRTEPGAQKLAELEGVSIRYYDVIYELVEDVTLAIKGLLEPTYTEVLEGQAEVLAVFDTAKKGKVAGVMVKEGRARRDALVRVLRKGQIVCESKLISLRRFKEDVKEVAAGFECGVGVEGFSDFRVGDIIQVFGKTLVT